MNKLLALSTFVFSLTFVSGCNATTTPISLATPESTSPLTENYPAPIDGSNSYPAPATNANLPTSLPEGILPNAPENAPQPSPDKASISGVLYSYTTHTVISQTEFFLIPAVGAEKRDVPPVIVKPEASRGEITSVSGMDGSVNMNDIPPGNYYIFVWAPMDWIDVQVSPTDNKARLIELKAGDRVPLGVLYVSWP